MIMGDEPHRLEIKLWAVQQQKKNFVERKASKKISQAQIKSVKIRLLHD